MEGASEADDRGAVVGESIAGSLDAVAISDGIDTGEGDDNDVDDGDDAESL